MMTGADDLNDLIESKRERERWLMVDSTTSRCLPVAMVNTTQFKHKTLTFDLPSSPINGMPSNSANVVIISFDQDGMMRAKRNTTRRL